MHDISHPEEEKPDCEAPHQGDEPKVEQKDLDISISPDEEDSTPVDPHEISVGGTIDSHYHVLSVLGRGTFGIVYLVKDTADDKEYALKMLKLWEVSPSKHRDLKKRFRMEFETGQITSDYLVHSISIGEHNGNPYFVMEYCSGGDLRTHLRKGGDLNQAVLQVLLGLRDLHNTGKIHRDLKPSNVLIRKDGTAALTDFGISGDQNKRMTECGEVGKAQQIFGTYGFMPPEQVRPPRGGMATVLPTTDVFSFGVMLYCLITGHLPFGPLKNEEDLMPYITRGREGKWDRSLLKESPMGKQWFPTIERCLEPDFHKRAQNVDELLRIATHLNANPMQEKNPKGKLEQPKGQQRYILKIVQGPQHGSQWILDKFLTEDKTQVLLGRKDISVYNDISIVDTENCFVSRKHCTLLYDKSSRKWFLKDGQQRGKRSTEWVRSLNGTYLNSTELNDKAYPLQIGDIITIGDTKLKLELTI